MADDDAPFVCNSNLNESDEESEDNESEEMCKIIKERDKIFESMSKYEKKLMKGLMRGFANTMILWLISKKRLHGYEIMTKLHESTPYEKKMPSASKIYPVLHELEKNKLIKGTWEYQGKRKVKYYEITEEGEETLSRFRKVAQYARKHKGIWLEFMQDMAVENNVDKKS